MTYEECLQMLKVDLGISTTAYDTRLSQYLTAAEEAIRIEGITIDPASVSDANLIIMYAGWLWKKRDSGDGIPRNLRWLLNNRLFSEKMGGGDSE